MLELMDKIYEIDKVKDFVTGKVIKASTIVTAKWVRFKCNGCRNYNTNLQCPPFSPTPEETQKILDEYEYAILIRCMEGYDAVSEIPLILEKIAIGMEFYKAIGFSAGYCKVCEVCNLKNCINRDKTRPSMEACGIDVFSTAKNNEFEMVGEKDGKKIFYYFVLVLLR
ncbi:MAG: DUF2284 domain-containing protein [Methanobrevibacter sp.]|jgi:predicted metal-binding protein|nr:DUF2284 domain-containing protein [Candidatus Methanovirga aequatorialis]